MFVDIKIELKQTCNQSNLWNHQPNRKMCSWAVKAGRRVIKKLLNDAKSLQKEWVCSVKRVIRTTTANILIESTHSRLAAQTSFLIVVISPDNFISHNLFLLNIAVVPCFLLSTHVIIYLESHLFQQHNAISLFPQTFLLNNAIHISQQEKKSLSSIDAICLLYYNEPTDSRSRRSLGMK